MIGTDPFSGEYSAGDGVSISEPAFYGSNIIDVGEEVFVWLSETSGGCGLAWRTRVASVGRGEGRNLEVWLNLGNRPAAESLSKDDLAPHRGENDGTPVSELARKLYRFSRN